METEGGPCRCFQKAEHRCALRTDCSKNSRTGWKKQRNILYFFDRFYIIAVVCFERVRRRANTARAFKAATE